MQTEPHHLAPSPKTRGPFLTSPRPRFRYYAAAQQSFAVSRDLLSFRVQKGNDVAELESAFCDLLDIKHAVAMPQARIGIFLAVSALTKGKKKKVILSPYTIHDVINMVICAGGQPVFADIEPGTCNIAADEVERLLDEAARIGGTLGMGSRTTAEGEVIGAANLFVADASSLPCMQPKSIVLTAMANADRIGRIIAQRSTAAVEQGHEGPHEATR